MNRLVASAFVAAALRLRAAQNRPSPSMDRSVASSGLLLCGFTDL
jgi:hypothetical protein